ncbi:MAG: hypothetical protein ICV69_02660 [Thermoleophilaceae bacterium]|nr:hypothetical protein [Thermoleophilaceae bacterium]
MKERRKGPIGRAADLAEGVAAAVRRMQREREPRVLVYDQTGYARLVQPESRGHARILEIGERMIQLADGAEMPEEIRRGEREPSATRTRRSDGGGGRSRPPAGHSRRSRGRAGETE